MIGNSIAGRVASFIKRCEVRPELWCAEGAVYKCALSDQGANLDHIIGDAIRDDSKMRDCMRLSRVARNPPP